MLKKSFWADRFLTLAVIALMLISACGCKTGKSEVNNADRVKFTDALGREVSVEKNPQRVAALLGSFADVWLLSGGKVCAAAEDAWDDFELELGDAVNLGGAHSPSLEAVFSANPQLVLASASTSSNVEMKESLEAAGITVAYFDVDCFADYLKMLDICTDITGRKDLYGQNGLEVEKQINEIKAQFKASSLTVEKRKILLLRISSGSVKAKGSEGTVLGEMLKELGCINIADDEKSLLENLSAESIIKQEPYRIFAVAMGDDTQKAVSNLEQILDSTAWNTLEAVKNKRIYVMDRKRFNLKPNVKWADSYEELSKILLGEAE